MFFFVIECKARAQVSQLFSILYLYRLIRLFNMSFVSPTQEFSLQFTEKTISDWFSILTGILISTNTSLNLLSLNYNTILVYIYNFEFIWHSTSRRLYKRNKKLLEDITVLIRSWRFLTLRLISPISSLIKLTRQVQKTL